jgi:hypothetical protein
MNNVRLVLFILPFTSILTTNPQSPLTNCTWLKDSSCCYNNEMRHEAKQIKIGDVNIGSTNIEQPSLLKIFFVILLAAMLSFILC